MFSFQSQPDVCVRHYVSNICTEYFIQNKLELWNTCNEKSRWFLNIQKITDKWLQVANSNRILT